MKCIKCSEELESDDNYCPTCGELTPHGYLYFKDNTNYIKRKDSNIGSLFTLTALVVIIFIIITSISGKDIFKPYIAIKKELYSIKYGYKVSLMNTTNKYNNKIINTQEEAKELIKEDLAGTSWQCKKNTQVQIIEKEISENYNIPSVNLCDVDTEEASKIKEVIDKTYKLFPNIKDYLTNITITNANKNEDYIAYFEPLYTFVNENNNIEEYNKINKTQILLNSYYFLNKNILNKGLKENWYPKDATYETLISHELGHYITYVTLLKENNIKDLTLVTKENAQDYQKIKNILDSQTYAKVLVETSLNNYNTNNNTTITKEEFVSQISNYASQKINGELNYDEVIAEAIHDYYLHEEKSSQSTIEIIKIIKERLNQWKNVKIVKK